VNAGEPSHLLGSGLDMRHYTGRGQGDARTTIRDDVATVAVPDAMRRGSAISSPGGRAAAELPRSDLGDALAVCVAIHKAEPEHYERATLRWLARY
jgi:hypothetical protein